LLDSAPKDTRLSSADTCGLYYFPEIPCDVDKGAAAAPGRGHFVSGAQHPDNDGAAGQAEARDAEQIQGLIEDAFNKGVDQGKAAAIAAQQENVDNAALALKETVEKLVRIRQQDVERMETETVKLALAIARKIIGYETDQGPVIGHVVRTAMRKVADPRHLTLRLNPKDIDTVRAFQRELLPDDDVGADLGLEADESIGKGGCIIETQLGDVDARIDQQIKIIDALLIEQLPKPHVEG
jgi:flagellar assembly protein FliH